MSGKSTPPIDILFDTEMIATRIDQLAVDIVSSMGRTPFLVSILTGGFVFTADLLRALDRAGAKPDMGFIGLSSYGAARQSSGEVKLTYDLAADIAGRNVLIVDDVLDSGRTLAHARALLEMRKAMDIRTCVLLDKKSGHASDVTADFYGFDCPDHFVVGYGLDLDNGLRHLPYIGVLRE